MTGKPWDKLDAELADTIEPEQARNRAKYEQRKTARWQRLRAACSDVHALDVSADEHADGVYELVRINETSSTSTPRAGSTVEGSSAGAGHRR